MTGAPAPRDWPLRAALLALAGALVALAVHHLLKGPLPWQWSDDPLRIAAAAFLGTAGLAFAFVVERGRQGRSVAFALVAASIVASVIYWNGPGRSWDAAEQWRLTCALLTVAIAAPLFQAWRDGGTGRTIAYVAAHDRAWTNLVLWFAAWAFVGIVWLLAYLLSELFGLIGLNFLIELLKQEWFQKVLTGGALGGAIGLLRDRERILGTLQRVVTTVLAVLAPILAAGLWAFLIALPFTGLSPLWSATRATTPILLSCVIGALVLANAVLGDSPEQERRGVLRWSAMALGAAMLPLGVIAAVSTGLRIAQYGLTPERLWAVVFSGIACAYGLAYLVALALALARGGWGVPVRAANLRLGMALCGLAFLLSTPLLSFNALATRDQLARLADGRTPPAKFDWAALRFDFGAPGKAAVTRLAREGATPAIRLAAADALKAETRWTAEAAAAARERADTLDRRIRIAPQRVPLPAWLRDALAQQDVCRIQAPCAVIYIPGAARATMVAATSWGTDVKQLTPPVAKTPALAVPGRDTSSEQLAAERAAVLNGAIEIREVRRRQVFINGKPTGAPFE